MLNPAGDAPIQIQMNERGLVMNGESVKRMTWLSLGVCTAALMAAPALAQAGATAETAGASILEEIIVTANRRVESVNRVAASVAALDQAALDKQGIRNFTDIVAQTPGLSFAPPSTFQPANIAIRGVRSTVGGATTGIYIDDTPIQARNTGPQNAGDALPTIFDLDRVEVLRGPQGTLFGSGSQGGSVRFISPTPDLNDVKAYARAEITSTDSGGIGYEGGVATGTPIIEDRLAVRLSASYRHEAGYVDRINERTGAMVDKDANSSSAHTMKAAALFAPNDVWRITPSVNFQETRAKDSSQFYARLSDRSDQKLISGRTLAQPSKDRFYLPALKLEAYLDGMTATSVTSNFTRRQSVILDYSNLDEGVARLYNTNRVGGPLPGIGVLPLPILLPEAFVAAGGAENVVGNRQDNFTQEIRLQSDGDGPFSWLVGGFFQRAKQVNTIAVNDAYYADEFETLLGFRNVNGITRYFRDYHGEDEQLAAFANADYQLGDLKLSGGIRAASMKFSYEEELNGSFTRGRQFTTGKQKESPITPKVSLTWNASDDAMVYASAAKGFRTGGANIPITPTPPCLAALSQLGMSSAPQTYDSDTVWNYEVGSKISLFDRAMQVNASAYHIDWSNIQSGVTLSGCPGAFTTNLGSANSDGFDLAISAKPTDALFLSLSAGYNRSRFAETVTSNNIILAQKDALVSDSPPWQIAGTVEYSLPLDDGDGYIRSIHQYASRAGGLFAKYDTPTSSGYDVNGRRNQGYHLTNLRVGWRNEDFDLSMFVDNLFNSAPQLNYISNAFPTDTTYYANTLRPRTIGVTLTARH